MIGVIGDSHVKYFLEPPFRPLHIGPRTAHQLQDHTSLIDIVIKREGITPKDSLMFLLGEIDCSRHFRRHSFEKDIPIIDLIQDTVMRYVTFVKSYQPQYKEVYITNIVPTGDQENVYKIPNYGTREERRQCFDMYNHELKKRCGLMKVQYLDVYNQLIGPDGWRIESLIRDECHLNMGHPNIIRKTYFNN